MMTSMLRKASLCMLACLMLAGCDEWIHRDGKFNVYYYHPDDVTKEIHLGVVNGLERCRLVVRGYRKTIKKNPYPADYTCCLIQKEDGCAKSMR